MADKKLIVVTRPIHEAGLKILKLRYQVKVLDDTVKSEKELKSAVAGADAIVSLLTEKITDAVLVAAGEQLKIVAQYAVGYDNIDLDAAKRRGVIVTNTPGFLSGPAVAEHAFSLLFAVARHTIEADEFMRSGKYVRWEPNLFLGQQLEGKTVGIIGSGQIGTIFAGMCHRALKMKVLYSDVVRNEAIEKDLGATKVTTEKLLGTADVVSLHVPLLPSTHHLIGSEQLHAMKTSAILINTSRGPVVDEKALVKALKEGKIYGAGLDVFEDEPAMSPGLAKLKNVVLTPHIGSATESARMAMAECVARNVVAALIGETPANIVK